MNYTILTKSKMNFTKKKKETRAYLRDANDSWKSRREKFD